MMAPASLHMKNTLMIFLCVMAMLAMAWSGGRQTTAGHRSPAIVTQGLLSAYDAVSTHRHCDFAHLLQSSGKCGSVNHVGLERSADDDVAPAEPRSSRLALAAVPVNAAFHRSRLERPPRV